LRTKVALVCRGLRLCVRRRVARRWRFAYLCGLLDAAAGCAPRHTLPRCRLPPPACSSSRFGSGSTTYRYHTTALPLPHRYALPPAVLLPSRFCLPLPPPLVHGSHWIHWIRSLRTPPPSACTTALPAAPAYGYHLPPATACHAAPYALPAHFTVRRVCVLPACGLRCGSAFWFWITAAIRFTPAYRLHAPPRYHLLGWILPAVATAVYHYLRTYYRTCRGYWFTARAHCRLRTAFFCCRTHGCYAGSRYWLPAVGYTFTVRRFIPRVYVRHHTVPYTHAFLPCGSVLTPHVPFTTQHALRLPTRLPATPHTPFMDYRRCSRLPRIAYGPFYLPVTHHYRYTPTVGSPAPFTYRLPVTAVQPPTYLRSPLYCGSLQFYGSFCVGLRVHALPGLRTHYLYGFCRGWFCRLHMVRAPYCGLRAVHVWIAAVYTAACPVYLLVCSALRFTLPDFRATFLPVCSAFTAPAVHCAARVLRSGLRSCFVLGLRTVTAPAFYRLLPACHVLPVTVRFVGSAHTTGSRMQHAHGSFAYAYYAVQNCRLRLHRDTYTGLLQRTCAAYYHLVLYHRGSHAARALYTRTALRAVRAVRRVHCLAAVLPCLRWFTAAGYRLRSTAAALPFTCTLILDCVTGLGLHLYVYAHYWIAAMLVLRTAPVTAHRARFCLHCLHGFCRRRLPLRARALLAALHRRVTQRYGLTLRLPLPVRPLPLDFTYCNTFTCLPAVADSTPHTLPASRSCHCFTLPFYYLQDCLVCVHAYHRYLPPVLVCCAPHATRVATTYLHGFYRFGYRFGSLPAAAAACYWFKTFVYLPRFAVFAVCGYAATAAPLLLRYAVWLPVWFTVCWVCLPRCHWFAPRTAWFAICRSVGSLYLPACVAFALRTPAFAWTRFTHTTTFVFYHVPAVGFVRTLFAAGCVCRIFTANHLPVVAGLLRCCHGCVATRAYRYTAFCTFAVTFATARLHHACAARCRGHTWLRLLLYHVGSAWFWVYIQCDFIYSCLPTFPVQFVPDSFPVLIL